MSHRVLLPNILLLLLLLQISSKLANCGTIVKTLPGFQGPLPFVLETGYVGVGENEDVQAFYYFIESENNPKDDPLVLWLSGGPGCSGLSALIFEIGPFEFKKEEYDGRLPNLVLRPQSWTKVSNIIFVDLPALTGFTYVRTESAAHRSDWLLIHQVHEFLRKWLVGHPEFLSNEVYIGGDSYSGVIVPVVVQEISQGNEKGALPLINLQGYLLGNPETFPTEQNYDIPFSHGMGLISNELYESLQKNCKGEYDYLHPKNMLCSKDMDTFHKIIFGVDRYNILEPLCELASPKPSEISGRRSLTDKFIHTHLTLPSFTCRSYTYVISTYWANDDNVQNALHVQKGRIDQWRRCNDNVTHDQNIPSSFPYHINLSKKGYRSLIYSGDHDMAVNFLGTQAWIKSLNYSIVDDWRQWYTNGKVAGYTRTYSNRMTFATVKGGGHTAPEYKPEECFTMFSRWISNKAL